MVDTKADGGSDSTRVDLAGAMAETRQGRGPGRPRGSGGKSSGAGADDPASIPVEEINKLFASENFEQLAGLYFDARYVITGWEDFRLTREEKKALASSLSMMVRVMVRIDPRYVALLVFTTNFGGLIASKEMQYRVKNPRPKQPPKGGPTTA